MDETLKAKIVAAVNAAIETVDESQKSEAVAEVETIAPHRFGFFRLPKDAHIKGFAKFPAE